MSEIGTSDTADDDVYLSSAAAQMVYMAAKNASTRRQGVYVATVTENSKSAGVDLRQRIMAAVIAFSVTFGAYALIDEQYASFAQETLRNGTTVAMEVSVRVAHGFGGIAEDAISQLAAAPVSLQLSFWK